MEIGASSLKRLLYMTQRYQVVAGKNSPQVSACVLRHEGDNITTTSLVRDGKTSVSKFVVQGKSSSDEFIAIPDIDRVLGVLKAHSGDVKISQDTNKTVFKSGKKQTSITSNLNGLAFPHSPETIGEWESKSIEIMNQVEDGVYVLRNGDKVSSSISFEMQAEELHDALSCDSINNQKLNTYTFEVADKKLYLSVGSELKGATKVELGEVDSDNLSAKFEGGLENVLSNFHDTVKIHILDFNAYNQGFKMILSFPCGSRILQSGVIE